MPVDAPSSMQHSVNCFASCDATTYSTVQNVLRAILVALQAQPAFCHELSFFGFHQGETFHKANKRITDPDARVANEAVAILTRFINAEGNADPMFKFIPRAGAATPVASLNTYGDHIATVVRRPIVFLITNEQEDPHFANEVIRCLPALRETPIVVVSIGTTVPAHWVSAQEMVGRRIYIPPCLSPSADAEAIMQYMTQIITAVLPADDVSSGAIDDARFPAGTAAMPAFGILPGSVITGRDLRSIPWRSWTPEMLISEHNIVTSSVVGLIRGRLLPPEEIQYYEQLVNTAQEIVIDRLIEQLQSPDPVIYDNAVTRVKTEQRERRQGEGGSFYPGHFARLVEAYEDITTMRNPVAVHSIPVQPSPAVPFLLAGRRFKTSELKSRLNEENRIRKEMLTLFAVSPSFDDSAMEEEETSAEEAKTGSTLRKAAI